MNPEDNLTAFSLHDTELVICHVPDIHTEDGPCSCILVVADWIDLRVEQAIQRAAKVAKDLAAVAFQAAEDNDFDDFDVMESLEAEDMALGDCARKILELIA